MCHFKRKLFSHKMTSFLSWNVKWLFDRFTFCHSTTVTLYTQWQNACMFLECTCYTTAASEPDNHNNCSMCPPLTRTTARIVLLTAYQLRNTRDSPLRSLPAFRSTEPLLSIFRKRSFTELTEHFFRRYSEQIHLAPHPFSSLRI